MNKKSAVAQAVKTVLLTGMFSGVVFTGGQAEAGRMLERFVEERLDRYDDGRRDLDHLAGTAQFEWYRCYGTHEF